MKKFKSLPILLLTAIAFTGCVENYSHGDRIGLITKFNEEGVFYKTWEGELNVTQTGYNSTGEPFNFSIDRKNISKVDNEHIIETLKAALSNGNKVKLTYHKVWGFKNTLKARGDSDYFIDKVEILE